MENEMYYGIGYHKDSSEPINFLETHFMDLSPFSAHQIEIWGEVFPTFEHAYQCARIKHGPERDAIKQAKCLLDAWREGQKHKDKPELLVENYDKDSIAEALLRAKLEQHPDIQSALFESDDRELLKVIGSDTYWGTGKDGDGKNKMGKLWMKLRDELGAKQLTN